MDNKTNHRAAFKNIQSKTPQKKPLVKPEAPKVTISFKIDKDLNKKINHYCLDEEIKKKDFFEKAALKILNKK